MINHTASQIPADIIIQGNLYTANAHGDFVEAIAIQNGIIIYAGSHTGAQAYKGSETKIISTGKGLAVPGFIDAHAHPAASTDVIYAIDLSELKGEEAYLEAIRSSYSSSPDAQLLYGFGWETHDFGPKGPQAAVLDAVTDKIPIVIWDLGYHNMWVNSAALTLGGFVQDSANSDPNVVRDENGSPTGMLKEAATEILTMKLPGYTLDQCRQGILNYQKMAVSYGTTAVFDACIYNAEEKPGYPGHTTLHAYEELAAEGALIMKTKSCIVISSPDRETYEADLAFLEKVAAREKDEFFRIDTAKYYLDGSLEGKTAFLIEPYLASDGFKGNSNWDTASFCDACIKTEEKGLRIHIHAIGDCAVRQSLDGIQAASEHTGRTDLRPVITHLQLVNENDFARFARYHVIAATQTYWFHKDGFYDAIRAIAGEERANRQYPLQKFYDAGIVVANSSDHPVTPKPRPLEAMETAVTRCDPGDKTESTFLPPAAEKTDLEKILRSFTIDAAYALCIEKETGSLEIGKKADLVLLDKNIFELPPHEISTAQELMTMINGKIVYQRQ